MVVEAIGSIARRLKSLWDEDIVWLLEEMGDSVADVVKRGPEVTDVIIRCEMLGQVEGDEGVILWVRFMINIIDK